ncbi:MAG: YgiT-type zinc finger protein [Nitrospirota bacterium]
MKCLLCKSEMKERKVTCDFRLDDGLFIVEHVPAFVCSQCGERVFSPETTDKVLAMVARKSIFNRTVSVPVADLRKAS